MKTNFEKMTSKKPLGSTAYDSEGNTFDVRASRCKLNKTTRGGGIKGLFRDPSTLTYIGDSTVIYG